jgi:ketosteroid isomerase-like protein
MPGSLQKLKFFCLTHQEPCVTERAHPRPMCEQGHVLSEDFLRDKWGFCCGCESFFKRNDHEAAYSRCPSCDRTILARYLCHNCDTLSFEVESPPPQRNFSISASGGLQPVCPCCLVHPKQSTSKHDCAALCVTLWSSRLECTFCSENIRGATTHDLTEILQPSFETGKSAPEQPGVPSQPLNMEPPIYDRLLRDCLQIMNGKAIKAMPVDADRTLLMEQPNGLFWLMKYQDDRSYVVFPSIFRLNTPSDFQIFQQAFECHQPMVAGELWVYKPALAFLNPTTRVWTIRRKGELKIQNDQSSPSTKNDKKITWNDQSSLSTKNDKKIIWVVLSVILTALIIFIYMLGSQSSNQQNPSLIAGNTSGSQVAITEREIEQAIETWRSAWEQGDWQTYSSFYASNFSGRNYSRQSGYRQMTRDEWLQDKLQKFRSNQILTIRLGDRKIIYDRDHSPNEAIISFTQSYQSGSYSDYGRKTLRLRKQPNGALIIVSEDFRPQPQ